MSRTLLWITFFLIGACERKVARVPQSDQLPVEDVRVELQAAGLHANAAEDYFYPLIDGEVGSGWCVCRDIGTSPHIGQDFVSSSSLRSVAVANGKILSRSFIAGCGWDVLLEDGQGVVWRYLHLDKPAVDEGEIVERGQVIGSHTKYPRRSCGSGVHLHLERQTAGLLGGKEGGKACKNGFKSCNFNPVAPLSGKRMFTKLEDLKKYLKAEPGTPEGDQSTPAPALPLQCSPRQPAAVDVSLEPEEKEAEQPTTLARRIQNFAPRIIVTRTKDERALIALLSVAMADEKNVSLSENKCTVSRKHPAETCIIRWEIQILNTAGLWMRLFVNAGARNHKLELPVSAHYCLPTNHAGRYRIVAWTQTRRKIVNEGEIESPTALR